ncbi:MAG: ABC transporter permease [Planctomycetes bacterium]|nr:ABC transporter permease [Planctomycetota bacterium]
MIRDVLVVARNDLRRVLRQRETWIWTFAMPLVFFYFFTAIQGGSSGTDHPKDPLTLVVPDAGGVLVDELERRLQGLDYEVARVAEFAPDAPRPARVVEVPAGFDAAVLAGRETSVRLLRPEGGNATELDRFRVSRAAFGVLADVVTNAARRREQTPESFAELAAWPRALSLDVRPAGTRVRIPSGKEQSIPGTLVMFTLVLLLTSGAMGSLLERRQGLTRRLASAPLSRGAIVLGKWCGVYGLGLLQIAYAAAAGTLFFGLEWGPDAWVVALVLCAWAAFVSSLALLFANLVATEGQVIGLGVLASNLLAALGGCWWPIEVTPRWMQALGGQLPSGATMNALHRLMIFQSGPSSALPALAYLTSGALLLGFVAARRFRFA